MTLKPRRAPRSTIIVGLALTIILGVLVALRAFGLLPPGFPFSGDTSHTPPSDPAATDITPDTPSLTTPGISQIPHSPNRPETAPATVAEQRRAEAREFTSPGGAEAFRKLVELYKQPHSGTVTLRAQSHQGAALVKLRSPSLPQTEPGDYGTKQFAIPGGYTWEETITITTAGQSVWDIEVTPLDNGLNDRFSCATLLEGHPESPYTSAEGPYAQCSVTGKTPEELGPNLEEGRS
ncbi:hypothetical protein [Schaalia sp. Marseille-Q2122]|uniref:hypothetical protein n=1 Tax=Schaalia sp. Marseille-Q2122 TaxID=2736604 RepID=UPI00158F60F6|nr:hypothetical protein [Schaalia sp. Marseille-Q2122]